MKRFMLLSCVAAGTLVFAPPKPAQAWPKFIIIMSEVDDVAPLALLEDDGECATVVVDPEYKAFQPGTHVEATLVLYQEATGAIAIATVNNNSVGRDRPDSLGVKVSILPGSPPLGEGPATLSYFAQTTYRGRVVNNWARSYDVCLID